MRGFGRRRQQKADSPVPRSTAGRAAPRPGLDRGPVIVLVEPSDSGREAVAWAAAEAAARDSELRIVHGLYWLWMLDPMGNAALEAIRLKTSAELVDTAEAHARAVAPTIQITSHLADEESAAALVREVQKECAAQSLVVLGRNLASSRSQRALTRQVLRRTTAAVVVVGLSGHDTSSPSAGRVVVAADGRGGPPEVLGFAFRAARRRGAGLTITHTASMATDDSLVDAVERWLVAYPEVDVQWCFPTGTVLGHVVAETAGAALTVLGAARHRRLRGSMAADVQRLARGPVVLVGTGPLPKGRAGYLSSRLRRMADFDKARG